MTIFFRHLRGVIVFSGLTLNTVFWFVPIMTLAIVKMLLPSPVLRRLITRRLMAFGENWISVNSLIFQLPDATTWQTCRLDGLTRNGWYLVVSNHQTWVDIIVLQHVFNRQIPFLKFFIKQQLVWFPVLGLAWWALDMPFMKRYSRAYLAKHPEKQGTDLEATRIACEKFRNTPTTVINFIEGTRFSEVKREARNSEFRYVLPPRAGGIAWTLASMGELFNAMLDVTLVYPGGPASFWGLCCGEPVNVMVDVRSRPIEQFLVSGDYENDRKYRREFHQWLTRLWHEKDQRIAALLTDKAASPQASDSE